MLNDNRIRIIHDFIRADDIFPSVEIKGGVCYFLWDRDNKGDCVVHTHTEDKNISVAERPLLEKNAETFIRFNEAIPILRKVQGKNEKSFSEIVSVRKPFGFATNYSDFKNTSFENSVKIYANQKIGYIEKNKIEKNYDLVGKFKVYIPEAIGVGNVKNVWLKPIFGEPNTCCTETYLLIGAFDTKIEAKNVISYMQTKFFHLFLSFKKITQHTTKEVYQFVPFQDFSESWNDEKLYKKYELNHDEIKFIESMIRPMNLNNQEEGAVENE
jgi:site-specific DNA-methyltransferase (adenine-specific)